MARRWWTLVAVSLAAFKTYLDNNVPNLNRSVDPQLLLNPNLNRSVDPQLLP